MVLSGHESSSVAVVVAATTFEVEELAHRHIGHMQRTDCGYDKEGRWLARYMTLVERCTSEHRWSHVQNSTVEIVSSCSRQGM